MNVRFFVVIFVSLVFSCGQPDAKLNSAPNSAPNNVSPNNVTSNNGADTVVEATDFDRACAVNGDCMLIHSGEVCTCDTCANGAISASAQPIWRAAVDAVMCDDLACAPISCDGGIEAFCDAGTCNTRTVVSQQVFAVDWDQSCVEAADCAMVYEGELCDECRCPNAAVNVAVVEQYQRQFDVCEDSPACPCASPGLSCNAGRCESF